MTQLGNEVKRNGLLIQKNSEFHQILKKKKTNMNLWSTTKMHRIPLE